VTAAARILVAGTVVGAYLLLGEMTGADDGRVSLLAVAGLVVCITGAAVAGPLCEDPALPADERDVELEEAWIDTMRDTPHLHLDRRPQLGWDLHAVHVGHEGEQVVLRHLVNEILDADAHEPRRVLITVADERRFTGGQVVEAALALDELREAAMQEEARSRVRAHERADARLREEQEELERAYAEAALRDDRARLAELARYRSELGSRLAAERVAQERRDAEGEARGLAKALRESRHPGPR
jgi:hypothetical protein